MHLLVLDTSNTVVTWRACLFMERPSKWLCINTRSVWEEYETQNKLLFICSSKIQFAWWITSPPCFWNRSFCQPPWMILPQWGWRGGLHPRSIPSVLLTFQFAIFQSNHIWCSYVRVVYLWESLQQHIKNIMMYCEFSLEMAAKSHSIAVLKHAELLARQVKDIKPTISAVPLSFTSHLEGYTNLRCQPNRSQKHANGLSSRVSRKKPWKHALKYSSRHPKNTPCRRNCGCEVQPGRRRRRSLLLQAVTSRLKWAPMGQDWEKRLQYGSFVN